MTKYMILYLFLLFSGCGVTDFYTIDSYDDIFDRMPVYDEERSVAPSNLKRFLPLLDTCKLQYPNGTAVPYGKLEGFRSDYFFSNDDILYFSVLKKSHMPKIRSELRQKGSWRTDDSVGHYWHAKLRCFKPKKGVDSYTWMQIHGTNDTFDFPILRLMWVRNYNGKYDHIWAIVIVSDPYVEPKRYEWVDMGKRPGRYFKIDVDIADNRLRIAIDNREIKVYDVAYWQDVENYLKAGVYVNRHEDHGRAVVGFEKLNMK